jgi:hypothetical protein
MPFARPTTDSGNARSLPFSVEVVGSGHHEEHGHVADDSTTASP